MTSICDITAISSSQTYHVLQNAPENISSYSQLHLQTNCQQSLSTLRVIRYQFPRAISTNANNMESNNQDLELHKLFDVKGKVALVTGGGI